MNRVLEAAEKYAELRLVPLPLVVDSKVPDIKNWKDMAIPTSKQISKWWKNPAKNIGLVMGRNHFCLDIDFKDGKDGEEEFQEFLAGRELPPSAEALTGAWGRHLLFRKPPEVRVTNQARQGLDVRGEGGFIVVYPSIHPETGREYEWIRHPAQLISPAPSWLFEALEARRKTRAVQGDRPPIVSNRAGDFDKLLTEVVERFPISGFGQRNSQQRKVVASLVGRGYTREIVVEVGTAWLEWFHRKGLVRTGWDQTLHALIYEVDYSLKSSSLVKASSGVDNRREVASIKLGEACLALIGGLVQLKTCNDCSRYKIGSLRRLGEFVTHE